MTNDQFPMTNQTSSPNDHWARLPRSFFMRETHAVAKDLLGKLLVRVWRGNILTVRMYEVECYIGENDRACHASRGRTARNEVMFGEAGHAYVYFIYGMYHCLNIVTERVGFPAAVLIRGAVSMAHTASGINLTPILSHASTARRPSQGEGDLNGPGKLCRALHITRAQNAEDLVTSERLFVVDDGVRFSPTDILTTPRIGVEYAGEDAKLPWRYVVNW